MSEAEAIRPLLHVDALDAYYAGAHVLRGVTFEMDRRSVAIIGRNGMGKTTLCAALVGLSPPRATGSVALEGEELLGKPAYKIARAGVGYVPQGRRLFPSLTVDEHLKIADVRGSSGGWNADRVYELFPRLHERRRNGGAQLSGGEQQMLAIGRALLGSPKLLIMDEPSEGLAPTVIERMVETLRQLEEEGIAILLIEQNLGVATAVAERQLIMVGGELAHETTASALSEDPELQRRYLGVEPLVT